MPKHRGKQKRLAKQKKRRASRLKSEGRPSPSTRPGSTTRSRPSGSPAVPSSARQHSGYDADRGPEPATWLQLDERDRMEQVGRYHEQTLTVEQMPPSLPAHVGTHVLVENQLAEDDPAEVRLALGRLVDEGLGRHEAIHAIGWVMADHMRRAVQTCQPVDRAAYIRAVEAFSAKAWAVAADSQS